jgi:hypothetical protein
VCLTTLKHVSVYLPMFMYNYMCVYMLCVYLNLCVCERRMDIFVQNTTCRLSMCMCLTSNKCRIPFERHPCAHNMCCTINKCARIASLFLEHHTSARGYIKNTVHVRRVGLPEIENHSCASLVQANMYARQCQQILRGFGFCVVQATSVLADLRRFLHTVTPSPLALSLSHTHNHTSTQSHNHTITHTHTHTSFILYPPSLSLKNTHNHIHTHTHTHTSTVIGALLPGVRAHSKANVRGTQGSKCIGAVA